MEHKLIQGGEQWLPFARSRVKALHALNLPYASQQFEMPDGASVKVRISPFADYITLNQNQFEYQFFSTGLNVTGQPYLGYRVYEGYAVATNKQGKTSKTVGSSIGSSNPLQITSAFPVKNIWQIQGIPEHVFYGRETGTTKLSTTRLVDSWSAASQIVGLTMRGGNRSREGVRLSSKLDLTYDVAPTVGSKGIAPDADWYKRAATAVIENDEFGSRQFIVMTDASDNFHVYPVQSELGAEPNPQFSGQAIKTNVLPAFARTLAAPMPAWCRNSDVSARDFWRDGAGVVDVVTKLPQYRWSFSSTGLRACAVVFEDLSAFAGPAGLPEPPFFRDNRGIKYPIQESLPGLLEVDIEIAITGKELWQFEAEVTLRGALRPSVTGKYIVGADYAWPMPGYAELDDLILMTGSIYHTSLDRAVAGSNIDLFNCVSLLQVENVDTDTALRSFLIHRTSQPYMTATNTSFDVYPAAKRQVADAIIMALDLRVLAFTVRQKYTERAVDWGASTTVNSAERDGLSAARIKTYVRNELVDEIVMEPAGSAVDAALVSFFEGGSIAGLFKMPITERGGVSAFVGPGISNAYWNIGLNESGCPYAGYLPFSIGPGIDVDVGGYLYASLLAPSLCMISHAQFAIHPQGHWSLVTHPVTYHPGPVSIGSDGVAIGELFAPSTMRSARVDIVSYRAKPTTEQAAAGLLGDETRTTHLALQNKAIGKDWTLADFLPKWDKIELVNPLSRRWILFDSVSRRSFDLERAYKITEDDIWRYEDIARPRTFDLQTESTQLVDAYTGVPIGELFDKTTLLGGSTLFI